jgi:SAM-dependent methyltransferase
LVRILDRLLDIDDIEGAGSQDALNRCYRNLFGRVGAEADRWGGSVEVVHHHSAEPYIVDWAEKAAGLVEAARDEQAWYESMAATLLLPADRVAVDVGCGGGGMTLALAAALGAGSGQPAQVVAVDAEPEVLATVRSELAARAAGELARVDTVVADLGDGVAPVRAALAGPADLVWASASVHHLGDQQAAVDALATLLATGGRLALAEGGLPARYLPWDLGVGEPGLELRLDAANDRWFARMRAELPGSVRTPYGWTEAIRRAGLADVTTRTVLRESPAPLPEPERHRVADRFGHWVDRMRPTGLLDPADLAAWDRLLDPDDPAWLGSRTDVFRLEARSVHVGTRAEGSPEPAGPPVGGG